MFANPVLDAKYDKANLPDIVSKMKHLNQNQKADILKVLQKHSKLFDGTLGVYRHEKFHIDIEEGTKPVRSRPYAVPIIQHDTFKRELKHLIDIGVLSPAGVRKRASTTFIIPKKDSRVRWVITIRTLNKVCSPIRF